jgi:hypothetical protein
LDARRGTEAKGLGAVSGEEIGGKGRHGDFGK